MDDCHFSNIAKLKNRNMGVNLMIVFLPNLALLCQIVNVTKCMSWHKINIMFIFKGMCLEQIKHVQSCHNAHFENVSFSHGTQQVLRMLILEVS